MKLIKLILFAGFVCGLSLVTPGPPARAAEGAGRLYGYASASSVRQGGRIDFYVSADPTVTRFDLAIARVTGTALTPMQTIPNLPAGNYACANPTGVPAKQEDTILGCDWPVAYTLAVPAGWPSGVYLAQLLDADDRTGRLGSYIIFIVTEDQPGSTSSILVQLPSYTWQAYNQYGGWSFYTTIPARRVTFERPYQGYCDPRSVNGCRFRLEMPLVRWLESEGYVVEYAASEDIHTNPGLLFHYKLLISPGHDEYWSKELREAIDAFIDAGGNVAFFSGNTGYRQVRTYVQAGRRVLVCYKSDWRDDPLYGVDNSRVATEFGQTPVPNWPENSTTGVGFRNGGYINVSPGSLAGQYTVYRSDHWVYANTGLQNGDTFVYETQDRAEVDGALFTWENGQPVVTGVDGTPLNYTILGLQPSTGGYATMGLYSRPGGGTVFNAATMDWARGLTPEINPDDYLVVQQITRNVIDRLAGGPPPPPVAVQSVSFTYEPPLPLTQALVTFTAVVTPVSATSPLNYTWQFEPGEPAVITAVPAITHTYAASGTFTASLTVANAAGSASFSRPVTVQGRDSRQDNSLMVYLPAVYKQ